MPRCKLLQRQLNILPWAKSNWTLNGATVSVSTYFIHKSLINLNEICQGDEAENYIVLSPKTISGYKNLSLRFLSKTAKTVHFRESSIKLTYLADNTGVLESTQSFHQYLQCSRCGESWKPPSYLGLILHGQGQHEPKMTKITPANILMWKIQLFSLIHFIPFHWYNWNNVSDAFSLTICTMLYPKTLMLWVIFSWLKIHEWFECKSNFPNDYFFIHHSLSSNGAKLGPGGDLKNEIHLV